MSQAKILHGDCLERLKKLPSDSIDSLVTDPPAGISFMGKAWDDDKGGRKQWIAWMTEVMTECYRVLKPGAHGLVWAIPRTSHWTATALEDAGFEVRDVVTHLFGSGFPKSMDISKAIDKAAGAERQVVGLSTIGGGGASNKKGFKADEDEQSGGSYQQASDGKSGLPITAPATDAAKQWEGWGTALKPASEHWILVRKPISEKNVAANVQKWGTGGINIDGSRIGGPPAPRNAPKPKFNGGNFHAGQDKGAVEMHHFNPTQGRFPANLVLSHMEDCEEDQCSLSCAVRRLDEQSGISKSPASYVRKSAGKSTGLSAGKTIGEEAGKLSQNFGDSGGASRFFYCAKISTSERNAGLEGMEKKVATQRMNASRLRYEQGCEPTPRAEQSVNANSHPTVKPKKLMSYLIRMITPPGGTVIDPFMGSGSTGVAAVECGFRFIGIEKDPEYHAIAEKRIQAAFEATA